MARQRDEHSTLLAREPAGRKAPAAFRGAKATEPTSTKGLTITDGQPEKILLLYARGETERGFSLLTRDYMEAIHRIAARRLARIGWIGGIHGPDDITHDALLRVHFSLVARCATDGIRNLGAWIYRIVELSIIDLLRKEGRRPSSPHLRAKEPQHDGNPLESEIVDGHLEDSLEITTLHLCLGAVDQLISKLSTAQQKVVKMWLKGHALHEIAAEAGMTVNGVAASKNRSIEKVRKGLCLRGWLLEDLTQSQNIRSSLPSYVPVWPLP